MKAKKGSYTPTTREVRRFYISESDPYEWGPYFDCWLEDIKAEAWDEGRRAVQDKIDAAYKRGWEDCATGLMETARKAVLALREIRAEAFKVYLEGDRK